MKRAVVAGALAGVILLSGFVFLYAQGAAAPAAGADAKKDPHVLRTSGTATVRVTPDAARVFFAVQTQAATVKEARLDNNNRVRKIMEALTGLKIANLKMKSSDVQVDILYGQHNGAQIPPITGYRVTNSFTVLVQDEDPIKLGAQASRVLDAALESGANSVQHIAFLSKKGTAEARRKALTQAVEDALANARALATGAKKDQIETVTIDGQPQYREYGRAQMQQVSNVAFPAGGEGEAALVIGDLEVTCQVSVSCNF